MTRWFGFLRGINVGGHNVRMERLRGHFEELGFGDVRTFIASGNVVFDAPGAADAAELEQRIEKHLHAALGWEAATFLRSAAEVAAIAGHDPSPEPPRTETDRLHVMLLRAPPPVIVRRAITERSTDQDHLSVHGREVYWLCRTSFRESTAPRDLAKLIGNENTMRNINTFVRIAKKYGR